MDYITYVLFSPTFFFVIGAIQNQSIIADRQTDSLAKPGTLYWLSLGKTLSRSACIDADAR